MLHLKGLGYDRNVTVKELEKIFKFKLEDDVIYFKTTKTKINRADGSLVVPASTGIRTAFEGWKEDPERGGESFTLTYYEREKANDKNPSVKERMPYKIQFIGSQMRFDRRQSNELEKAVFFLLNPMCKDSKEYFTPLGHPHVRFELFSPNAAAKAKMATRREKKEFLDKLISSDSNAIIGIGMGLGDHNSDKEFILDAMYEQAEANFADFKKRYEDPRTEVYGVVQVLKSAHAIVPHSHSVNTFEWKYGPNFKGASNGESIVNGMGTESGVIADYLMSNAKMLEMFSKAAFTILAKEKALNPQEVKKIMDGAKSLDGKEVMEVFTTLATKGILVEEQTESGFDYKIKKGEELKPLMSMPANEDQAGFFLEWANENKKAFQDLKKL